MRSSWLGPVVRTGSAALYADAVGEALRAAGVQPGDIVGLVGDGEMPHRAHDAMMAQLAGYEVKACDRAVALLRLNRVP